ncbi:MAG: hypothetical protein COA94_05455 [Rickettsiales bacterium]|nr:MAG: hypothetical protein COA94_05455 [Rickettsiales bacterium]
MGLEKSNKSLKPLKTLVKLNKNKMDTLLKEIKYRDSEKDRLEKKKQQIEDESQAEIARYSGTKYAYMLDNYMQNARKSIKIVDAHIEQVVQILEKLREVLETQYSELKKFEIILEMKIKQQQEQEKIAETKAMDEFNSNKFIYEKEG